MAEGGAGISFARSSLNCIPSSRQEHQNRRKEDVSGSADRRGTPEEDEHADDDEHVVDAADFVCPLGFADHPSERFAVADDAVGEDDPEETLEDVHRITRGARRGAC